MAPAIQTTVCNSGPFSGHLRWQERKGSNLLFAENHLLLAILQPTVAHAKENQKRLWQVRPRAGRIHQSTWKAQASTSVKAPRFQNGQGKPIHRQPSWRAPKERCPFPSPRNRRWVRWVAMEWRSRHFRFRSWLPAPAPARQKRLNPRVAVSHPRSRPPLRPARLQTYPPQPMSSRALSGRRRSPLIQPGRMRPERQGS